MADSVTIPRKRYDRLKRDAQATRDLIVELDAAFRRALAEGVEEV